MIPVTKPYLPNLDRYQSYVENIFERRWLTNNGVLVQDFERKLKTHLNLDNLVYVANGTIAIQLAIKALDLKGEILTTPFSYVATSSSIVWEGCEPVFVDIDEHSFNINPLNIEASITNKTSAILATHCYGNACEIEAIEAIAKRHQLKVIYDAAHCFGTEYKGKSIFEYGDIVTTSLHATKLMHSVEGGLVFAKSSILHEKLNLMRNFGHFGPDKYKGLGINGKNSEFHAAMGLCVLADFEKILQRRKEQALVYDNLLQGFPHRKVKINNDCKTNYAYYPIVLENEVTTLNLLNALEKKNIFPRRYFFPSLSSLDYVKKQHTPISDSCASKILCLPLYHELSYDDQKLIVKTLKGSI